MNYKNDTSPDIVYSLHQEKQISSLKKEVIVLKELLGKRIDHMVEDIIHNRLTIKTIKQIRNICDNALKGKK